MQQEFQIGDFVVLNSGSPLLKVIAREGEKIKVEWDGPSGLESMVLPAVCFRSLS